MDWLKTAREEFSKDRYATETTGIVIDEAEPGYAKCSLELGLQHCNAHNKIMGGAIFTLADFAFAIASNLDRPPTVAQNSNITFLSSPIGKKLYATARIVRAGKRSCFSTIDIEDDTGRKVAYVTASGMTVELKK